jgi:hypothetical protein
MRFGLSGGPDLLPSRFVTRSSGRVRVERGFRAANCTRARSNAGSESNGRRIGYGSPCHSSGSWSAPFCHVIPQQGIGFVSPTALGRGRISSEAALASMLLGVSQRIHLFGHSIEPTLSVTDQAVIQAWSGSVRTEDTCVKHVACRRRKRTKRAAIRSCSGWRAEHSDCVICPRRPRMPKRQRRAHPGPGMAEHYRWVIRFGRGGRRGHSGAY